MKLEEVLSAETYAQVSTEINAYNANQTDKSKQVRFVDLSEGAYVGKGKYDDTVGTLQQQVTDLQGQITQRDTDLANLNTQLSAAQENAGQLTDVQSQLSALQIKYDKDSKAWEAKNAQQAYEYAVKGEAAKLNFTSTAAKNEFIREAIAQKFKVEDGTLMGYSDFVEKYKTNDPGAFVANKNEETKGNPTIVLPGNSKPAGHTMSLTEAMKAKNANPDFQVSFN